MRTVMLMMTLILNAKKSLSLSSEGVAVSIAARSTQSPSNRMAWASRFTLTTPYLKDSLRRGRLTGLAEESQAVVKSTKGPSSMTLWKARGYSSGLMGVSTMERSMQERSKAKVPTCGRMDRHMWDSSKTTSAWVRARFTILMARSMRATGRMERNMVQERTSGRMGRATSYTTTKESSKVRVLWTTSPSPWSS